MLAIKWHTVSSVSGEITIQQNEEFTHVDDLTVNTDVQYNLLCGSGWSFPI